MTMNVHGLLIVALGAALAICTDASIGPLLAHDSAQAAIEGTLSTSWRSNGVLPDAIIPLRMPDSGYGDGDAHARSCRAIDGQERAAFPPIETSALPPIKMSRTVGDTPAPVLHCHNDEDEAIAYATSVDADPSRAIGGKRTVDNPN